eukprot:Nk52_evm8s1737 gene=Nk52_evmTU8s1737
MSAFKNLVCAIVLVSVVLLVSSCQAAQSNELLREVQQFNHDLSFYRTDDLVYIFDEDYPGPTISGIYSQLTPTLTYFGDNGATGNTSLEISGVRSSSKNPYVTHFVDSYADSQVNCSNVAFERPQGNHHYDVLSKFGIQCDEGAYAVNYYSFLENALAVPIKVFGLTNVSINSPFTEQDLNRGLVVDDGHASINVAWAENVSVNNTVARQFTAGQIVGKLELNALATAKFIANSVQAISGNVLVPFLTRGSDYQNAKYDILDMVKDSYVDLNMTFVSDMCSDTGIIVMANNCFDLVINGEQVPCVNDSMKHVKGAEALNFIFFNFVSIDAPRVPSHLNYECVDFSSSRNFTQTFNQGLLKNIPYALANDSKNLPSSPFQYQQISLQNRGTQIVKPLTNTGEVALPTLVVLVMALVISLCL